METKETSKVREVPRSTFKDKINSKETDIEKVISTRLVKIPKLPLHAWRRICQLLSDGKEEICWANKKYSTKNLWTCLKNGLVPPLSILQGRAGWKLLRKFMYRHPRVRSRKPQVSSAARVKEFTKQNVAKFFEICEPVLRMDSFSPHS